jgi:hypothetical protein
MLNIPNAPEAAADPTALSRCRSAHIQRERERERERKRKRKRKWREKEREREILRLLFD